MADWERGLAFLRQACHDRDFAQQNYTRHGPEKPDEDTSSWCEVIAKSQQSVEKAIKALALVNGVGLWYTHPVIPHLTEWLSDPRNLTYGREIGPRLQKLFTTALREQLRQFDTWAPRKPLPGNLHAKNTEYPFQARQGWVSPSDPGAFAAAEVTDAFQNMRRVVTEIERLVLALQLAHGL